MTSFSFAKIGEILKRAGKHMSDSTNLQCQLTAGNEAQPGESAQFASLIGRPEVLASLTEVTPYHVRRTAGRCHMLASTSAAALYHAAAEGCEVARLDCDLDTEQPILAPPNTAAANAPAASRLLLASRFFQVLAMPRETVSNGVAPPVQLLRPDASLFARRRKRPPRTESACPLHEMELRFSVSSNEEHVEVEAAANGVTTSLRPRVHNYLLLTLARQRLSDGEQQLPEQGWISSEQLCRMLRIDQVRLNLDVFRIRRQFELIPIATPQDIIERRHDSRELRIGASRLSIR